MCLKGKRLLVACSQQVDGIPELVRLLPLGRVHSQKGDFVVDEESFRTMCRDFASHGNDLVIDYEHQTLTGTQAPAAGWIKELVLSGGAICGRVEWTPRAAEYLKNREYRYLSPVVMVRESDGKALRLKSSALTNTPAIDGMYPIINSLNFDEGEDTMDLTKQIAALLGLSEDADEATVLEALRAALEETKALKAKSEQAENLVANKLILSQLALKDDATTAEVTAKIAAMQNPANFVPVERYNEVVCKLNAQESAGLVELALKDGKITPAQKPWAEEYIKTDPDGFRNFLSVAAPVVPMTELTLSAKPIKKTEVIPGAIRDQLGISKEDLEKYGKDVL